MFPYLKLRKPTRLYAKNMSETPNGHTQIWNYAQYLSKLGVLKTEVATAETRGQNNTDFFAHYSSSGVREGINCEFTSRKRASD